MENRVTHPDAGFGLPGPSDAAHGGGGRMRLLRQKVLGIVALLATVPVVILEHDLTASAVIFFLITLPLLAAKERAF